MAVEVAVLVSKRLAAAAAALLCLAAVHLVAAVHTAPASPTEVRVAIAR